MGVWILMMFTMDFARLGRPEDRGYHTAVTFGWLYYLLTFLLNGLIGILLVSTFGISFDELAGQESALPVEIVGLTGVLGLLLIIITQMRINTVNLYLASSNLESFFSVVFRLTLPRTFWLVVACIAGFLLMLTNIFSYVLDALAYQGIAIVAWVGIALAHVAYLHRTHASVDRMEFRPGRIPAFNPGGITAWVVATTVGVVLKITDSTESQFFEIWGLPLTFVIAFGLYSLATVAAQPQWFSMGAPERSDRRGRRRVGSAGALSPLPQVLRRPGDGPRPDRGAPGDLRRVRHRSGRSRGGLQGGARGAGRGGKRHVVTVALNCDIGEGFGIWRLGDDAAIMPLHLRGQRRLRVPRRRPGRSCATRCALAKEHGVEVGRAPELPGPAGLRPARHGHGPGRADRGDPLPGGRAEGASSMPRGCRSPTSSRTARCTAPRRATRRSRTPSPTPPRPSACPCSGMAGHAARDGLHAAAGSASWPSTTPTSSTTTTASLIITRHHVADDPDEVARARRGG